jgi:hypothetical protein
MGALVQQTQVKWLRHFRNILILTLSLTLPSLLPATAWTKVEFDSNQLLMKNAEQISELVGKKIKLAQDIQKSQTVDDNDGIRAEPGAVLALKDGLRMTLSRPDQDGTRTILFARVRRELSDLNSFDETILQLAQEGIESIKDKKVSLRIQATYVVLLNGLIMETKPDLTSSEAIQKVIAAIRDANLKISDELKHFDLLRAMSKITSPSETAEAILPKKIIKKSS